MSNGGRISGPRRDPDTFPVWISDGLPYRIGTDIVLMDVANPASHPNIEDWEPYPDPEVPCRVYWRSHGCDLEHGHDGPHVCCPQPHITCDGGDDCEHDFCHNDMPLPDDVLSGEDA